MPEETPGQPQAQFKPNIYPIMYWALAFGVIAGLVLFVVFLLARFITIIWFPVFLAGLIWGAYRNYQKQKVQWHKFNGMPVPAASPLEEFKQATRDIIDASRDMVAQQAEEDAELALQSQQTLTQEQVLAEEQIPGSETSTSRPPTPPPVPPRIV